MKRLLYIFLFLSALCIGVGSCHKETSVAGKEVDSTAFRLAVMPTMDCLPFYYADSLGLFDSLGVNIRLVTFDAAMDADTAFLRHRVDGIVSDLVKQCTWQSRGDSLTEVMAADLHLWLVTSENARLLNEASLKDRVVGSTRNSAEDMMADLIMESVKLPTTDLNRPQINNLSLRTLMVDQNQYDGALLPEPYASEAVARGAVRLTSNVRLNMRAMMTVLVRDSVAKARGADVDGIAKAYDMAVQRINADTTSNMLLFLPKEHTVYVPDSLYTPIPYTSSTHPSDSMVQVVQKWVKSRGLDKKK